MDIAEHIWTPSFWRLISSSPDPKRQKIIQKIILHKLGKTQEPKDNSKKLENFTKTSLVEKNKKVFENFIQTDLPEKKVIVKIVFPRGTLKDTSVIYKNSKNPDGVVATMKRQIEERQQIRNYTENFTEDKCKQSKIYSSDSQIVYKLVSEKFKHILHQYHQRKVQRLANSKNSSFEISFNEANFSSSTIIIDSLNTENNSQTPLNGEEVNMIFNNDRTNPVKTEEDCLNLQHYEPIQDRNLNYICTEHQNDNIDSANVTSKISSETNNVSINASLEKLFEDAWSDSRSDNDSANLKQGNVEENSEDNQDNAIKFAKCNSSIHQAAAESFDRDDEPCNTGISDKTFVVKNTDVNPLEIYEPFKIITGLDHTSYNKYKESFLLEERIKQYQLMIQTSKALNYFVLKFKDFESTPQYLDLERSLLVAAKKFKMVKKIEKQVNQPMNYEEYEQYVLNNVGEIKISNLSFVLTEKHQQNDKSTRWFIAVLSHDTTVLETKTVKADKDGIIRFPNSFKFEKLNINFKININIYMLQVKNSKRLAYHKDTLKLPILNKSPHKHQNPTCRIRMPSFMLCGTTTINKTDLTGRPLLKLSNTSDLRGTITMNLATSISFPLCSAFLNIGTEINGNCIWNRRWTFLDGYKLKCWNYPTESSCQQPIDVIDLSMCANSYISQPRRKLHARPYTLLLETRRASTSYNSNKLYQITRHYLSADNAYQMEAWEQLLNSVLHSLVTWNCVPC